MSARKRRVPYEEGTRVGFTFPDGETRRPKRNVETPEIDICSFSVEEGISPAFDLNRALLRRVFFLDENKTQYVSVAFYPSMGYMPMVEFGGSKIGPIRLSVQQVMALVEYLPRLSDASCANAHYTSGIHNGFWIITTTYRAAWMYLGQRTHIAYKLSDLRYFNTIMPIAMNQLARYSSAMTDVMTYAMSAMASTEYSEPLPTYSKNILYPQLYEELKTLTIM